MRTRTHAHGCGRLTCGKHRVLEAQEAQVEHDCDVALQRLCVVQQ